MVSLGDDGFPRVCTIQPSGAREGGGRGRAGVWGQEKLQYVSLSTSGKNVFAIGIPFNK